MKTILISGGRGLIGKHLSRKLKDLGYNINILSSSESAVNSTSVFYWNIAENKIERKAINSADFIVHLAGANIGDKRWTAKRKQLILDSRVKSARLIYEAIEPGNKKLMAFISASAVGFYGMANSDKIFSEEDSRGLDFLGETCKLWEESADRFSDLGIRTVKIRTGVVLTKRGGALEKMITPVKMGIGSGLGNGKQFLPWIHIEDLCGIYIKAIEDIQMEGAYNAVAPDNRTNEDFIKALAGALNKPFWFPNIPAFLLKLFFGEMAGLILKGSRVSGKKIEGTGFLFKFRDLETAFNDLLRANNV